MAQFPVSRRRVKQGMFGSALLILVMLLLSACGDPQASQQASQNRNTLQNAITHAESIGVPITMLQPILKQYQQLNNTNAPFGLFNDASVTNYNTNLAQRYQMLTTEVQGLVVQATQQLDFQASQDLQNMENALAERQSQNFIEAKIFEQQLTTYQQQLAQAQFPKDYIKISQEARRSTQALHLMGPAYNDLQTFQGVIKQLQDSRLDVTGLNQQAQDDLQAFRSASTPEDYSSLIDQINTQLQETTVFSTQAIPFVGAARLKEFSHDIDLLKQYGGNAAPFQQKLTNDQQALASAKTINDFLRISTQIDNDTNSIQFPLTQSEANYLLRQFHQEVTSWGTSHQYHDSYDGGTYNLDYEYDEQGIGSDADAAVQSAQTLDDYLSAIDLINDDLTNLHAMEADYNDHTPWNQPHNTDLTLMQHYNVTGNVGPVLVVSFIEQTLRYYNNGKLVRSFLIVSGQYLKPSPPGFWHIFLREHPTEFKSSEPPGSAFWYPPTPIQYAMEYHVGGYFFHDSWWRGIYGPGMNFPHSDPSGTTAFNSNGSHGCINMNPGDIAWLYNVIPWGTPVITY
ncbi:MAG TPA: L,D-transpeptidase family protein [Ktedonobacteraceae bacterium]|nr:L,D-transpeptidase family protein [Ktedonobacteraceae bacterium]